MYDTNAHPLLAQVPLTVSPFLSLPTTPSLPYTYKALPTTIPASSTEPPPGHQQIQNNGSEISPSAIPFVTSSSGMRAASPDDIIASCTALQQHLAAMRDNAQRSLHEWDDNIKARELAEKRRVAPGWLDRSEKILEPIRTAVPQVTSEMGPGVERVEVSPVHEFEGDQIHGTDGPGERGLTEGDELDRAFGVMSMR